MRVIKLCLSTFYTIHCISFLCVFASMLPIDYNRHLGNDELSTMLHFYFSIFTFFFGLSLYLTLSLMKTNNSERS